MLTFVRISCLLSVAALITSVAVACGSNEDTPRTSDVDGGSPFDSGPRALDSGKNADAASSPCGNGVLDPGEECDLGDQEAPSCKSCRIPEYTLTTTLSRAWGSAPTVAASTQGYSVMWMPDDSSLLVRAIAPSGAAERAEQRIDTHDGGRYSPDSVRLTAGPTGFMASWDDYNDPEVFNGYRFRPLNPRGEPQGERELSAKLMALSYKMVVRPDRNGYALIYDNDERTIRQTSVSLEGVLDPTSDTAIVTLPEARTAAWISAASGSDGSIAVAWMERGKMRGDPQEVHVASIKEGKTTWSTAFPRTSQLMVRSQIAILNDGRVFIAWYAGFDDRVEAAWIKADGTPGAVFMLDYGPGIGSDLSIAFAPKGEVLVVWEGEHDEILARHFSSNGEPTDTKASRLTHAPSKVESPVVAAGADGSFLVVYRETSPTNTIRYQLLPPGFRKNP